MEISNQELVSKFTEVFKLRYPPIAFFYTNNPPIEVYKPKKKALENRPCIIQFLNGVKSGRTLVLGKASRNLCPGGLSYLGFKKPVPGTEAWLSSGIYDKEGNLVLEGEKILKTSGLAKKLIHSIPYRKAPADYAVFIPLDKLNGNDYTPLLIIFFVTMDQLSGLIQLSNYDTTNKTKLGLGSDCQSIITEPLLELDKDDVPKAIVGMLSDITGRKHIKPDEATITISPKRLREMYKNIDESFLELKIWKSLQKRMHEK